jgi:hypothetical protein
VDKESKSPSLPFLAHKSCGEGGNSEFSSPFYFFLAFPNFFLWHFFN